MGVVRASVQTVEEIYRLVWAAAANRQPIEAVYQGRLRLFCPHRLGRNREGRLRVLCYQYGGDSGSTPASWLAGKLALYGAGEVQQGEVNGRCLAHGAESFAPNLVRGRSRYRCRGSSGARSAKRALRQLPQQQTRQNDTQRRDGVRIMPLRACAQSRVGESPALARGQRIQDDRRGQRGKNGSARPPNSCFNS